MDDRPELAPFLDAPGQLLQLCKEVVERLDEQRQGAELDEYEKQLREIARAIDQLEKADIAIPDELRRLKTDLVAKLAVRDEISNKLAKLADGFKEVLQDLRSRTARSSSTGHPGAQRRKRSTEPTTSGKVFRKEIIRALKVLGGSGSVRQVLAEVEKQLAGKMFPRDLETLPGGDIVWQKTVQWLRYKMTQDGTLKNDSPRGIWELGENHR